MKNSSDGTKQPHCSMFGSHRTETAQRTDPTGTKALSAAPASIETGRSPRRGGKRGARVLEEQEMFRRVIRRAQVAGANRSSVGPRVPSRFRLVDGGRSSRRREGRASPVDRGPLLEWPAWGYQVPEELLQNRRAGGARRTSERETGAPGQRGAERGERPGTASRSNCAAAGL